MNVVVGFMKRVDNALNLNMWVKFIRSNGLKRYYREIFHNVQ